MNKETLLSLPIGTVLYHQSTSDADFAAIRARINGRPRLWKRRPDYFELPMKHGSNSCFYITPANIANWKPAK